MNEAQPYTLGPTKSGLDLVKFCICLVDLGEEEMAGRYLIQTLADRC
jgi:hypothetical protein